MDNWLLEERRRLLQLGTRAFIKAGLVALVLVVALMTGVLVALDALALEPAAANAVLIGAAVIIPLITFFVVDWLRRRFWLRAIGSHTRRLRAVQFLSHYADAVGEARLNELPASSRKEVSHALEKERQGLLPGEKEYALAIQPLIVLDPERGAPRGPRRQIARQRDPERRHHQA